MPATSSKRDAEVFLGIHLAAAAAEGHRRAGPAELLRQHEEDHDDDQRHRDIGHPDGLQRAGAFGIVELEAGIFSFRLVEHLAADRRLSRSY